MVLNLQDYLQELNLTLKRNRLSSSKQLISTRGSKLLRRNVFLDVLVVIRKKMKIKRN